MRALFCWGDGPPWLFGHMHAYSDHAVRLHAYVVTSKQQSLPMIARYELPPALTVYVPLWEDAQLRAHVSTLNPYVLS